MEAKQALINGIDVEALGALAQGVAADPSKGLAGFEVVTSWKGGTRSDTRVESWRLGEKRMSRDFTLRTDEPLELLGGNTAPNPQEMLMAAFNACMTVGYVAGCALAGVELRSLSIRTEGQLDLRGFLGLDASVAPGYEKLRSIVSIDADAPEHVLREIHETVLRTSPNRWNITRPVKHEAELHVVGR